MLVLGMCFFAGGTRFSEQGFGISGSRSSTHWLMAILMQKPWIGATQLNSSLLTVSVIAVLLPAAFHFSVPELEDSQEATYILAVSHGVAIILLVSE